jgi:hypothetical protein
MFFFVVEASARAMGPLDHLEAYSHKLREPTEGTALAGFVCGAARRIHDEFDGFFSDTHWARDLLARCPEGSGSSLLELNVLLILHNAAGYHRRFIRGLATKLYTQLSSIPRSPAACFGAAVCRESRFGNRVG